MIDLKPEFLVIVKQILREHVPEYEVWVFGSRVKGTAKSYLDLDLALVGREKLKFKCLYELREAFQESELPIRVDVIDWQATSDGFKNVIEKGYERLDVD